MWGRWSGCKKLSTLSSQPLHSRRAAMGFCSTMFPIVNAPLFSFFKKGNSPTISHLSASVMQQALLSDIQGGVVEIRGDVQIVLVFYSSQGANRTTSTRSSLSALYLHIYCDIVQNNNLFKEIKQINNYQKAGRETPTFDLRNQMKLVNIYIGI